MDENRLDQNELDEKLVYTIQTTLGISVIVGECIKIQKSDISSTTAQNEWNINQLYTQTYIP